MMPHGSVGAACRPRHALTIGLLFLLIGISAGAAVAQDPCDHVAIKPFPPNLRPVNILNRLDIDGDGVPDQSIDADQDGLPDNWEVNAAVSPEPDGIDRFVSFSAPTAISPGTPSTFVLFRLSVTTSAHDYDTDDDCLSDFVEVFGLKYIDDNRNGVLDFDFDDKDNDGEWDGLEPYMDVNRNLQYDPGEPFVDVNGNGRWDSMGGDADEAIHPDSEWMDFNLDGLPSIGEYPLPNVHQAELGLAYDFDGFVFTDPANPDTDGDGVIDGLDRDPLINPETFGIPRPQAQGFTRAETRFTNDADLDDDGLGNGSDFADDRTGIVDFPTDIAELIELFRPDRLTSVSGAACRTPTLPESLVEDLLGADWNGDGLFRLTDVRDFRRARGFNPIFRPNPGSGDDYLADCLSQQFADRYARLFMVEGHPLFGSNPAIPEAYACEDPDLVTGGGSCAAPTPFGRRGQGLGWQLLLVPAERSQPWFPDVRIWTILYAWRVPGFDLDGNGYMGSPENSFALDDLHRFSRAGSGGGIPKLDGRIEVNPGCGDLGLMGLVGLLAPCAWWMLNSRRRAG